MLHISAGYPSTEGVGAKGAESHDGEEKEEGTVSSGELDLQSLLFGMRSFVDKVSSHEGAEFPWYVGTLQVL